MLQAKVVKKALAVNSEAAEKAELLRRFGATVPVAWGLECRVLGVLEFRRLGFGSL